MLGDVAYAASAYDAARTALPGAASLATVGLLSSSASATIAPFTAAQQAPNTDTVSSAGAGS